MGSIRKHKKSKLGCIECKTRRVKCDETHPSCGNCRRRRQTCNYPEEVLSFIALELELAPKHPQRNILELELLHHYTTNTCLTLMQRQPMLDGLQLRAPQLAFQYPYLLSAIFCVTALHISDLRMDDYYATLAEKYYQEALDCIKADNSVGPEGETYYLFNVFIPVYICKRSVKCTTYSSMISMFITARKYISDLSVACSIFMKGKFVPWFALTSTLTPSAQIPAFAALPESIGLLCRSSSFTPDPDEVKDPVVAEIYKQAVEVLRVTHSFLAYPEYYDLCAALFFCGVSDDFVEKLKEGKPRALVILAHQCAVLTLIDPCHWWVRQKGYNDFCRIVEVLDPQWMEWIEWPLEMQKMAEESMSTASSPMPQLLIGT